MKTQTRRLIVSRTGFFQVCSKNGIVTNIWQTNADEWTGENLIPVKHRYNVGEIVYLKEPYYILESGQVEYRYEPTFFLEGCVMPKWEWKNKLFMPAWAARSFIKITDVRAERLQSISDEDCIREGICLEFLESDYFHYYDPESRYYCADCEEKGRERLIGEAISDKHNFGFDDMDDEDIRDELDGCSMEADDDEIKICDICGKDLSVYKNPASNEHFYSPQEAYSALIDKISGKGTWESNPWVWVYDYVLCDREGMEL